jgi:hypothetical protein
MNLSDHFVISSVMPGRWFACARARWQLPGRGCAGNAAGVAGGKVSLCVDSAERKKVP